MNMLIWRLLPVLAVCGFLSAASCDAADPKIVFDIPSKIECHDVTPEKCAAAHPSLKVIEARFRISAGFIEGNETSATEFIYLISSPDMRLKILNFLPNTTLESSTAEDRIEVTDQTESSDSATGEVRVGYSLLSLNGTKNTANKKTESNHYQKVASKHLVLASGTVNRGHGVFYKLRPSHEASLEGAKEFVLLCIVPRDWRGDWCSVVCSARTNKKNTVSSATAIAGVEQAHVGLFLAGDRQASDLSDELTRTQTAHGGLLAKYLAKDALHHLEELHAISTAHKAPPSDWFFRAASFKSATKQSPLDSAKASLSEIEERFVEFAGEGAGGI